MKQNINELEINGTVYIPKGFEKQEIVEFTGEESIASRMIGKPVIVRSSNEGINIGIVVLADETGVELKDCRRLYYHRPADKSLSWYEGVAMTGISNTSKVSGTVKTKVIIEKYSMTLCTNEAYQSVLNLTPNEQN